MSKKCRLAVSGEFSSELSLVLPEGTTDAEAEAIGRAVIGAAMAGMTGFAAKCRGTMPYVGTTGIELVDLESASLGMFAPQVKSEVVS